MVCVHVALYAAFSWCIMNIFFQQGIATSTQKLINMLENFKYNLQQKRTITLDDLIPMKKGTDWKLEESWKARRAEM